MENIKKYQTVFIDTLNVREEELSQLKYQSVQAWDSVGHMNLISSLEDAFDIMIETDDIVEFNSYEKGKEILKKYEIEI